MAKSSMHTQLISYNFQQILLMMDQMNDPLVITDHADLVIHLNPAAQHMLETSLSQHSEISLKDLEDLRVGTTQLDIDLNGLKAYRISPFTAPPGSATSASTRVSTPNNTVNAMMVHQPTIILQILEKLGICILGLDECDRIHIINAPAARLFGCNAETARGRHISLLLPDFDIPVTAGRSSLFQVHFKDEELSGYRITTDEIPGISTVLAFLNFTQLRVRDIERSGLLRMLIHDLSNPLYIALNFGRLIQDNLVADHEINQAVSIIVNNLERMQDLLRDLSILDQLGENIAESFVEVELDMIVATVLANLEERAAQAGINLSMTPLPAQPCITLGNERLIHQALHNLVENAVKYTLPGGWVRVTLRENGSQVETLISDSGIGIEPAEHQRLFKPFFRVKDPRMQQVNGTGLGLNLVKMVTEQHGGDIRFYTVPEQGSIFVLCLPSHPRHSVQKC